MTKGEQIVAMTVGKTNREGYPKLTIEHPFFRKLRTFMADKHYWMGTATDLLVNELIDRIEVHAPRYMDGKRYQMIDIYYKGVGIIKTLSPEDFEKSFQKNMAKRKQQRKTA